jgi:integrase
MRFANDGAVEPLPKAMKVANGAVAVLVCPMHKSGDMHRTAVSQEVLEAAERLRSRGWPADSQFPFYEAVESACKAAKIPPFTPGRFRHSAATWAIEAGADPASVAAFLGHKSPATTKRFYATVAVVPKVPTLV